VATFTALLDACVLYSAPLRDLLVNLALTDLFRARWTEAIHDEWTCNLRENRPDLPAEKIARTRELLDASVPDCLVAGYGFLIPTLDLPDPEDRHVLAAAIHGRADAIVTYDLAHFPAEVLARHHLEGLHPDEFVTHLLSLDEPRVIAAVKRLRAGLRKPPVSAADYLAILERQSLPLTVARIRPFIDLI
jgi:hypothetical protein